MTPELTALTLAALLQVVQFCLVAIPANLELGLAKTMSPRDDTPLEAQLSPRNARLFRAMNNHFESLILFAIACLVITFSDQGDKWTAGAAGIYLIARVLYIPAYAFGWVPWRTFIWMVAYGGIVALLFMALT